MGSKKTYFTSDVHLGLQAFDPQDRQRRFVAFLESINNEQTQALYLLGDIWDFWHEWKNVVPKGYNEVFSAIRALISNDIKVYFCPGNHDMWTYGYFEKLGMTVIEQPYVFKIDGITYCVGHGDGLGKVDPGYRILSTIFHSRVCRWMFAHLLPPDLAMRLGQAWSRHNRLARGEKYIWKGAEEPLARWCAEFAESRHIDFFIFGHYHVEVDQEIGKGSRLQVLDSWIDKDCYICK